MSLALRRSLYFRYALTAVYRMSPVPTNAREVEYIHQSFRKVAPIEYFLIGPASASEQNCYRQKLTVVFNSWDHGSLLNQHQPIGEAHLAGQLNGQLASHLDQRQQELRAFLLSVCGLPRYSYIEDDEMYMAGKTEIRFKHTLAKDYAGTYTITPSTEANPFFTVKSEQAVGEIVPLLRQNFQKIHKLEPMSVRPGVPSHLKPSHSPDVDVNVNPNSVLSLSAIGDLDRDLSKDLGFTEPPKASKNFNGFHI